MRSRTRRKPSMRVRMATRLLVAGAIGGHTAAALVIAIVAIARGTNGLVSALLAAVVALAFNIIGHAVQVMVADADPKKVLVASLASYTLRVTVLGVVLMLVLSNAEKFTFLDAPSVVWTTVAVVFGWLGAEFWAYNRLRIPVFDIDEEN